MNATDYLQLMGVKMLNTIPLLTLSMQLFNCLPNPLESRASSFRITTTKTLNCRGTLLDCRKATSINTDSLEREIEKITDIINACYF